MNLFRVDQDFLWGVPMLLLQGRLNARTIVSQFYFVDISFFRLWRTVVLSFDTEFPWAISCQ
jgi:hypothetical protein